MADKGWIKLHRQIQDCWIWHSKPFSEGQAWMDIVLSCNHADKKIAFDGKPYVVERGQWITSVLGLSDRWGWSRKKVSRFLNILESDGMIVQERNNKRTLLKVLNYEVYQAIDNEEVATEEHQRNIKGTSKEHQKNTNKNDKNYKNNKEYIYINNIKYIVEFLNQVCGTNYKPTTESTKKHIKARLDEGYTVEDFEIVIKSKYDAWHNDKMMSEYLRPKTLFAPSHFESYLNQAKAKGVKANDTSRTDDIVLTERQLEYFKGIGEDESIFDGCDYKQED